MGRISDQNTYPLKANPTGADYLIGTDSQDQLKSVSYTITSIQTLQNFFGAENQSFGINSNARVRLLQDVTFGADQVISINPEIPAGTSIQIYVEDIIDDFVMEYAGVITGKDSFTPTDQGELINYLVQADGVIQELDSTPAGTNIDYAPTATNIVITSSTGSDADIPPATEVLSGWLSAADKTKLNGIEDGAEVNPLTYPAEDITAGTFPAGTFIFTDPPEVPTPVDPNDAANKAYVDSMGASNIEATQVNAGTFQNASYTFPNGLTVANDLISQGDVRIDSANLELDDGRYIWWDGGSTEIEGTATDINVTATNFGVNAQMTVTGVSTFTQTLVVSNASVSVTNGDIFLTYGDNIGWDGGTTELVSNNDGEDFIEVLADSVRLRGRTEITEFRNDDTLKFWSGTQAQYDAIGAPDADTIYFVEP